MQQRYDVLLFIMKNLVLLLLVAVAFARLESVLPFSLRKLLPTRSPSALTSEALPQEISLSTSSEMLCPKLWRTLWDSAEEIWLTTGRPWSMRAAPSTESSPTSWSREEISRGATAQAADQSGGRNSTIKTSNCSMNHSASQWPMPDLIPTAASSSSLPLRHLGLMAATQFSAGFLREKMWSKKYRQLVQDKEDPARELLSQNAQYRTYDLYK